MAVSLIDFIVLKPGIMGLLLRCDCHRSKEEIVRFEVERSGVVRVTGQEQASGG